MTLAVLLQPLASEGDLGQLHEGATLDLGVAGSSAQAQPHPASAAAWAVTIATTLTTAVIMSMGVSSGEQGPSPVKARQV
ncbi:hypothetical protein [Nonomuraea typhae]|uniref:hypothetical protein n=1 Tax=Nonomuraea typhae TaxID=2603600 RepID=UPI0012F7FA58|nr:hypothetical protein [Nonomuraea typhae]